MVKIMETQESEKSYDFESEILDKKNDMTIDDVREHHVLREQSDRLEQSDLEEGSELFKIFFYEILPRMNLKEVFRLSAVASYFKRGIGDPEYKRVILNGTAATITLLLANSYQPGPLHIFENRVGGELTQTPSVNLPDNILAGGSVLGHIDNWLFGSFQAGTGFFLYNRRTNSLLNIPAPISNANRIRAGFGFSYHYNDYRIAALIYTKDGLPHQFVYSLENREWIAISMVIRWRRDLPSDPPIYWKGRLFWYDIEYPSHLVVYSLEKNQYYPLPRCNRRNCSRILTDVSQLSVIRNKLTLLDCHGLHLKFHAYNETDKEFEFLFSFHISGMRTNTRLRSVQPLFIMLDDSILCLLNNQKLFSFNLRSGWFQWKQIGYPAPEFKAFPFFG